MKTYIIVMVQCINHKMYSRWPIFTIYAITLSCGSFVLGAGFQDCLRKDSISCLQIQVYRKAKSIVSNKTISLIGGALQIQTRNDLSNSTSSENYDKLFGKSIAVETRQRLLETYLMEIVKNLWTQRTIAINPSQTVDALISFIPNSLKDKLANLFSQGRGKNKKLKKYMPLLVGIKIIFVTLASVAFVVIAVIANKAIFAAVISLLLAGYEGITDTINPKLQIKPEIIGYDTGSDWQSQYGSHEVHDITSAYSEPAPYQKTFIGHKGG